MLCLVCFTCGAASELDISEVVAHAQMITFVDAHYMHDEVRIRLFLWDRHDAQLDVSYLVSRREAG